MTLYKLMSGSGFVGGAYSHDWIFAWVSLGILGVLWYVAYISSKNEWIPEFNYIAGLIGIAIAVFLISFLGWTKLALLVGFVVMILAGYLIPNG